MSAVPEYLEPWMITQRWFAGKSRKPSFELLGEFGLTDPTGAASIRVLFVLDSAEHPLLYQVPLTERSTPLPDGERALVATIDSADGESAAGDSSNRERYIYDGPQDPAFAGALFRLILDDGQAEQSADSIVTAAGHQASAAMAATVRSSRILGGEQSNTSIIFETVGADGASSSPVICKLFRALHDGDNPDVVLTELLGAAGSRVAPRSIGHVTAQWPDAGKLHGVATGHLAFAQEFFPGVEDAWRVALRAAESGEDFGRRARALGVTTAEMHETLASALPSRATTPADIAIVVESMRHRFELAATEVPSLAGYRDALESVYHAAAESPWPPLQRIHGDFHLGQVLAVPERGWVVVDFEGEPLRPMTERSQPDISLRDVAGMLRSFDYVAGSYGLSHPGESAAEWASVCRRAFVDGYIERSGRDLREHHAILDAFEIDKALYEAVYEARNRPGWLSIPTDAISRLVERTIRP